MPAYLGGKTQMAGMKWYGSNVENKKKGLPRSILMMMLNDKDTGAPLAMMSANLISSYRTGAIPGVGAKHLAKKECVIRRHYRTWRYGQDFFESIRLCLPWIGYSICKRKRKKVTGFISSVCKKTNVRA